MQHAYRYALPSSVIEGATPRLSLATADPGDRRFPYFFEGRVRQPRLIADLLTAVHVIVGSRFYTPPGVAGRPAAPADPVVTSGGGVLRFEGFSGCCGAYIRADLLPQSYEGVVIGKGTTNVDFNAPMRAALARVRDDSGLALSVGQDEVTLRSAGGQVTERKVDLPARWIRGMLEVQSYQARMQRRFEAPAVEALRFFRSLPKSRPGRTPLWIARGTSGLYTTTQPVASGVRVTDMSRLRVLDALLPQAKTLSVFADDAHQASAWALDFGSARLALALSAETWRGFSGEGQALWSLMQADGGVLAATLARVRAQLQWQAALDANLLAGELHVARDVVASALQVIGASGLAGYDVFAGSYFHRVLPFDLTMLEEMHPRLADAKAIIDGNGATVLRAEPFEVDVKSGDVTHRVREVHGELHCTCPWFARHQSERGPCKHVLAASVLRPSIS